MDLAYCGLDCSTCEAFVATQENSDVKRKQVAEKWSKMFGANIEAEEINCNGCHSDLLFSHCKVCDIRKCGQERKLNNCGECSDFGCDKLKEMHEYDPMAKKRLERIANM